MTIEEMLMLEQVKQNHAQQEESLVGHRLEQLKAIRKDLMVQEG